MSEAVKSVVEDKRATARTHTIVGLSFSVGLLIFLLGPLVAGHKLGVASFAFGSIVLGMLVLGFLSSSRALKNEASRLEIISSQENEDLTKLLLEELDKDPADGTSTILDAFKDVLSKRGTE